MDKKEFKTRILELGELRRVAAGFAKSDPEAYEDRVFVPHEQHRVCPDCGIMVKDRKIVYEARMNESGQLKFRTKCRVAHCYKTWYELRL